MIFMREINGKYVTKLFPSGVSIPVMGKTLSTFWFSDTVWVAVVCLNNDLSGCRLPELLNVNIKRIIGTKNR